MTELPRKKDGTIDLEKCARIRTKSNLKQIAKRCERLRKALDVADKRRLEIPPSRRPRSTTEMRELEREISSLVILEITWPLFWECFLQHNQILASSWAKYARTTPFGRTEPGRFQSTWDEFVEDVFSKRVCAYVKEQKLGNQSISLRMSQYISQSEYTTASILLTEITKDNVNTITLNMDVSDAIAYEMLCASILRRLGWAATTTKASGDQGVDVIAIKGNLKLVLQCKNYNSTVGNKAVQEVIGARGFERAHAAAVVAPSGFTRSAESLAGMNGVGLLHHSEIEAWARALEKQAPE